MSLKPLWPIPSWVVDLPDVDRESGRTRYLLGLAAMTASRYGTISALARIIDIHPKTLHSARERGIVTPEMAIAIERKLGRDLFPRELFRPDLFALPEQ